MCSGRIGVEINEVEAVAAIKTMHYELDRLIHNANTIPYDFDSAVVTVLIVCWRIGKRAVSVSVSDLYLFAFSTR